MSRLYVETVMTPIVAETHLLIRVERRRYLCFTCPKRSQLELVSFDLPKRCPVCRKINPVGLGNHEGQDEFIGMIYEPDLELEII